MNVPLALHKFSTLALTLLLAATCAPPGDGQKISKTLAERLGYPSGTKLVIIHGDDLAETHAVNAASMRALESGAINSASIMVPCPWFPEMVDYAKSHPDMDLGLHLTLTAERVYYRWGPVASKDKVPSLVDSNGYFHHDWSEATHINPQEAELELRAQVDRALAMGLHPTHLDSHQYRLIDNGPELFAAAVRVAHDYKLPLFVTRDWFPQHPYLEKTLAPNDVVIDHTVTIEPSVTPEKWNQFYMDALKNLQPGVTEFVIHVAFDDEELKAATRERPTWGAAWRQRDYDFFSSPEFREILRTQNIKLVSWREIANRTR